MADDAATIPDPEPDAAPTGGFIAAESAPQDADRGVARLDPADLTRLGARPGDVLRLEGAGVTHARALPAPPDRRGGGEILLDSAQRAALSIALGETLRVMRVDAAPASAVRLKLSAGAPSPTPALQAAALEALADLPLTVGDCLRLPGPSGRPLEARVVSIAPSDGAVAVAGTRLTLEAAPLRPKSRPAPSRSSAPRRAAAPKKRSGADARFDDLGGLARQVSRVREMVETPLRRPDLFERLGVSPPKGVLFTGPPGSGKTLLARAVAAESGAAFFQIDGPEIVTKHYGDSEARLREIFKKAEAEAPSVIFIDEIDAIAQRRDAMAGERQLERRIVAQLLTLMDGLGGRGAVVVMAATNLPNSLDPALRRPGRFDREIAFTPPDKTGRAEILAVHTRAMPLADDVDLSALAAETHGYVGADLAALAREAAMAALRRVEAEAGGPPENADALSVEMTDFQTALREIAPSVVREVAIETPEVRWSDVGGFAEAKAALVEAVIWPLRHPEAFRRAGLEPSKGVLLAGPPGGGKTHLARALANEAGVNFIALRGAELLDRHVGESERAVREIFAKARLAAPCILFFDEFDALAPRRGRGGTDVADRVVAQLLTEIDGLEELRGVFLLAATNRADAIDPALTRPGRFDRVLEIGPPDAATRRDILEIHAKGRLVADGAALESWLDAWAARTDGWLGAELKALLEASGRRALRRWVADAGGASAAGADSAYAALAITAADLEAAAAEIASGRAARAEGIKERAARAESSHGRAAHAEAPSSGDRP